MAAGTAQRVTRLLLDAGIRYSRAMSKLRLQISSKSVIVASTSSLARSLSAQFRKAGVEVRVENTARDLGLLFNAGRRRRTTLQ
eukprot:11254606-Alexandrium_andersonii.AAC.1